MTSSRSTHHGSVVSATDEDEDDNDGAGDAGHGDDFVFVDKRLSASTEADKNVDKLLKFVADNDFQMVSSTVITIFRSVSSF